MKSLINYIHEALPLIGGAIKHECQRAARAHLYNSEGTHNTPDTFLAIAKAIEGHADAVRSAGTEISRSLDRIADKCTGHLGNSIPDELRNISDSLNNIADKR